MRDMDPKSLWDELVASLRGWMEPDSEEDEEQASDPSLAFHLMFAAPLIIGLLVMVRR